MKFPRLSSHKGAVAQAVVAIGAGVGLAAMLFALADAYMWKPLPYVHPDRLVSIQFGLPADPARWFATQQSEIPSLASWRARTDLFDDVAAFNDRGWERIQLSDRMVPLRVVAVTDNLFNVLGIGAHWIGFDAADAWLSRRAVALSGGQLATGRSVVAPPDGALRVRGVLPSSFLLPEPDRTLPVDALVPMPFGPVIAKDDPSRSPLIVGRARPGITPQIIAAALDATMPAGRRVSVVPLSDAMKGRQHELAVGALLAAGLIVLVCCTNVFNIALTRGLYRLPEIATRIALGATPTRIVRHLVTEALNVTVLASAAACVVVWLGLAALGLVMPPQFATLGTPAVTARVAFAIVVSSATAGAAWCLASILAWQFGTRRPSRQLIGRDGRAIRLVRFAVIAGQLGAASVLLAGAALLGRSYLNLLNVDIGMDERTETLTVAQDPNTPDALRLDVVNRTIAALRGAGGIQAVGAMDGDFLDSPGKQLLSVVDFAPNVWSNSPMGPVALWTYVAGNYFEATGMHVISGDPSVLHASGGVVITESLAHTFRGSVPAVLTLRNGTTLPITGVVRDVRSIDLTQAPRPSAYQVGGNWYQLFDTTYVFRATGATSGRTTWERTVRSIDPLAVVLDSGTIGDRLGRSIRDRTFASLVVGLFALAAILVTMVGLAGIVAYTVVKRRREIAIRLALGATRRAVTELVVHDTLIAGTCGIAAGIVASVWLSKSLTSLLYGVPPADPSTLLITSAMLVVVLAGSAILPGIRAARIAPAAALRIE
jgi:predicted permease